MCPLPCIHRAHKGYQVQSADWWERGHFPQVACEGGGGEECEVSEEQLRLISLFSKTSASELLYELLRSHEEMK